jgi:hypothetical protein
MLLVYTIAGIGGLIGVGGLVTLGFPALIRRQLEAWMRRGRLYVAGIVRLAIGTIFIFGSGMCSEPALIMLFGILFVAAGVIALLIGEKRLESMTGWFAARSDGTIRLWGIVTIAFGALVVFAAL